MSENGDLNPLNYVIENISLIPDDYFNPLNDQVKMTNSNLDINYIPSYSWTSAHYPLRNLSALARCLAMRTETVN